MIAGLCGVDFVCARTGRIGGAGWLPEATVSCLDSVGRCFCFRDGMEAVVNTLATPGRVMVCPKGDATFPTDLAIVVVGVFLAPSAFASRTGECGDLLAATNGLTGVERPLDGGARPRAGIVVAAGVLREANGAIEGGVEDEALAATRGIGDRLGEVACGFASLGRRGRSGGFCVCGDSLKAYIVR